MCSPIGRIDGNLLPVSCSKERKCVRKNTNFWGCESTVKKPSFRTNLSDTLRILTQDETRSTILARTDTRVASHIAFNVRWYHKGCILTFHRFDNQSRCLKIPLDMILNYSKWRFNWEMSGITLHKTLKVIVYNLKFNNVGVIFLELNL